MGLLLSTTSTLKTFYQNKSLPVYGIIWLCVRPGVDDRLFEKYGPTAQDCGLSSLSLSTVHQNQNLTNACCRLLLSDLLSKFINCGNFTNRFCNSKMFIGGLSWETSDGSYTPQKAAVDTRNLIHVRVPQGVFLTIWRGGRMHSHA